MAVILPFQRLLNTISHDINERNLRSLINICAPHIPERIREDIKDAWDVFQELMHQHIIGDDLSKMLNLLQIMTDMKPKRKDIINKVKDFIRTNYDPNYEFESSIETPVYVREPTAQGPPAILVGNDTHSSDHEPGILNSVSTSTSVEVRPSDHHCTIDCCCIGCNCYSRQIPTCVCLIITFSMAMLTFLASLLWFKKMPQKLYDKLGPDTVKAGPYIVGLLALLTVVCLVWWIHRKIRGNRVTQIPFSNFTDVTSPRSEDQVKARVAIPPANPLPNTRILIRNEERQRYDSATALSSVTTAASTSTPVKEPNLPSLSYPDGKDVMENGGLQTDRAGDFALESEVFQSRESLFHVDSDFSDLDAGLTVVPSTTFE